MDERTESPDLVAHKLATSDRSPVRIHVLGGTLSVPTEPYRSGTPPTVDVPVSSFEAVVDGVDVVDGGLNVAGFGGLHLPASEWDRVGLGRHWHHEDAAVGEPFSNTSRRLELWASREDQFYDAEPEAWSFEHLSPIPDDSPLIGEWTPPDEDIPDRPPVPLSRPTLSLYAVHARDADPHSRGFDRVETGAVGAVDVLDQIDEWPEEPKVESVDIDLSPPPRHPEVEYHDLDPLPCTETILAAVEAINRHAKRLDEEADQAYRAGAGAEARAHSLRKKALYRTKTVAVHRLTRARPRDVRVTRHVLNGNVEMYCFYFPRSYSFHQPMDAVSDELLDSIPNADVAEPRTIEFEATSDTSSLDTSLADALETLSGHGLNANDYLDSTIVRDYDFGYEISTTFGAID